jgi:arabinogalactan endo-1,4-beta-galactosidase
MRCTVLLLFLLAGLFQSKVQAEELSKELATKPALIVGCDPNYTLAMERANKTWSRGGKPEDVCSILKSAGMEMARIRLWTKDDGPNGLHESTALMKRAKAAGMLLYVAMFLCDDWADYIKQPAPAAWKDLTFEAKLKAVEAYAERVARHFAEQQLPVEYWEIGNEIDFGLCGVFEEEWPKRVSTEYMSAVIWPKEAAIIRAAQKGIKRVQPNARFVLHLTQWWNPEYNAAFFKSMTANQAAFDLAGLSFFPTSNLTKDAAPKDFFLKAKALSATVERPIMLCEFAYPSEPKFPGQFAEWNRPVAGYTLDADGQARWIADFLASAQSASYLRSAFYWSPEWYDSPMWPAFALFDSQGRPKKALASFAPAKE